MSLERNARNLSETPSCPPVHDREQFGTAVSSGRRNA
jgi:hypothetical protein